jgi:hypothetical protein
MQVLLWISRICASLFSSQIAEDHGREFIETVFSLIINQAMMPIIEKGRMSLSSSFFPFTTEYSMINLSLLIENVFMNGAL